MNSQQLTNLISTIVQSLLGMLVAKGLITGSESDSLGGALAALAVFFITHKWSSTKTSPPSSGGVSSGGGKVLLSLAVALLACGAMTGCSTTTPQQAAYATAGTASVTVQTALETAVTNASQTITDLVTLIQSCGVPLKTEN